MENLNEQDVLTAEANIGRGLSTSTFFVDYPAEMIVGNSTAVPASLILADRIVFNIAAEKGKFDAKLVRMSIQDVDHIEVIGDIIMNINRRQLSGEVAAANFIAHRINTNAMSDDAAILRDAYVTFYYGLFNRLDPWFVTPNVNIIFTDYDFNAKELHVTIS